MNVQDDPLVKNIKQPLKLYYVLLFLYDKNEYSPLEICRGFPKFVFTLLIRVRPIKVGSQKSKPFFVCGKYLNFSHSKQEKIYESKSLGAQNYK